MSSQALCGEKIWITGASSGIGKQMALELADRANHVFVSARSRDSLASLSSNAPGLVSVPCDVTDADSIKEAAKQIQDEAGYLDRVIINAGACEYLDVADPDWNMMRRVMEVNFFGAVNTVAEALPLLRNGLRRFPATNAHIVVVGSLSSVVPFPRAEAYGTSKAAVAYFFDSLRIDLARENIAVTVVQPGFVETPLTANNDFPMPFMLGVEDAARIIVKKLPAKPRRIRFPQRLSLPLRFFSVLPALWNAISTKFLSRGATAPAK